MYGTYHLLALMLSNFHPSFPPNFGVFVYTFSYKSLSLPCTVLFRIELQWVQLRHFSIALRCCATHQVTPGECRLIGDLY
jgi:hypothetical protein